MEIQKLDKAINILEDTIAEFPLGVYTKDDFKPLEEKIMELRKSLTLINARCLTLKALINSRNSSNLSEKDLNKSFERLNASTSTYLINKKTLMLCYQSRAIQDIIYRNEGTKEIQEKVKICLKKLFILNDKILAKHEKKKELMKKQYNLKLKAHLAIYDHHEYLKEKEARRKEQLEESNPEILQIKEKINRSLTKIYTMKKLITNLIAPMCHQLCKKEELVEMLAKHKNVINYETIKELAQNLLLESS